SLFLFGGARLRPRGAGRHLRARLPAHGRGASLRHPDAAEEDPPHRHDRALGHTMSEALNDLGAYIREKLGARIEQAIVAYGELTLTVPAGDIVDVVTFLKRDAQCQFISIIDVCGADYPARQRRFDVVYHLLSPRQNQRIRVKVMADEDTLVPSVTQVFPGADWFERETYDLYGILFSGHPDLRRILTDY